jgi:hypothetical protein
LLELYIGNFVGLKRVSYNKKYESNVLN